MHTTPRTQPARTTSIVATFKIHGDSDVRVAQVGTEDAIQFEVWDDNSDLVVVVSEQGTVRTPAVFSTAAEAALVALDQAGWS